MKQKTSKNKAIRVLKYSGEMEEFDVNKLIISLERANTDKTLITQIVDEIKENIQDGMTTKHIYNMAFAHLRKKERLSASKYKLKMAIMELGPSGFPFEKFIGKILEKEGFETKVGILVQGHCIQHEIDVAALKGNKHYMIECKFHSDQGKYCNVKIPLYIQSRFLDVEKQWKKQPGHSTKFHQGWIYTNTRFSDDAINFGTCMGLRLVSWDYPENNGLKHRIERSGLHPLTSLTSLTRREKTHLLNTGIVLCQEVLENAHLLEKVGIPRGKHKKILSDARDLCALS